MRVVVTTTIMADPAAYYRATGGDAYLARLDDTVVGAVAVKGFGASGYEFCKLVVADAAARAVEFVGLPEAQLNLAQAVVHLACAPKSNRVTVALGRAQRDVREAPRGDVPTHLRDAHYRSAATIGHGQGYDYPHDHPDGYVDQEYRPAAVAGTRYYEPSDRGHEAVVAERLLRLRGGGTALPATPEPPTASDPPAPSEGA